MMKKMRNMTIKSKLALLIAVFMTGFLLFAIFSLASLNNLKVNGPIYNRIVQGKDLIADILPPPEYIIESYLMVYEIINEKDPQKLDQLIEKTKSLKNEYDIRHEVWVEELEEGPMKEFMVKKSYDPAIEFYTIMEKQFIPLIRAGNIGEASQLANTVMKQKYYQHRANIDEVVKLATARNATDEAGARKRVWILTSGTILLGVILLASIALIFRAIQKAFRPLYNVNLMLKDISEGEGDLTKRISVDSKDEIAELATYFNVFVGKLQKMVGDISSTAETIGNNSNTLLNLTNETASTSQGVTSKSNSSKKIVMEINSKLIGLAESIKNSSGNINLIAAAVEEISSTIRNLASASEEVSASVTSVSDSAKSISVSISKLSESSRDVSGSMDNVSTSVKDITNSLESIRKNCDRSIMITSDATRKASDTNEIINKLNISSKQIEKIISVINDIADQTNMLALNAAIEAAGAGEAGKGFAVVANEVKELAKQTSEATDEISQQISNMQYNMTDAVKAVETITEVIKEINNITSTIGSDVTDQSNTAGKILDNVVNASDKVNSISKEIEGISENANSTARSMSEASNGVREIARSATELSTASNEAAKNVEKVSSMVQEVVVSSNGMLSNAKEVSNYIDEITESSTTNTDTAMKTNEYAEGISESLNKLNDLVGQFKI